MPGITTPYEGRGSLPWRDDAIIPAPLRLHETAVCQDWVDYNGHMSESAYLLVFGDSSDAFFRFFGVDEQYRASGWSLYTVETHLRNLREARLGDGLRLTLHVLGVDGKRLHILHEMYSADAGLVATAEQLLVHADTRSGRAAPFPEPVAGRLARVRAAHAALPVPGYVGHVIAIGSR
jgi:acyl-CoA thioester hydrolase